MFVRFLTPALLAGCLLLVACGSTGGQKAAVVDTAAPADTASPDAATDVSDVLAYDGPSAETIAPDIAPVDKSPKLLITKPVLNAVSIVGTALEFEATVSDDHDDPTALTVVWTTDLATGTLHTGKPNSAGLDSFTTTSLPAGAQIIHAEVTDSAGNKTVAAVKIIVDSLPGAPKVAILPEHPTITDALTAVIVQDAVDADRGPTELKYTYVWWKNGAPSSFTGPKVLGYIAKKGENWSVHVSATDPYAGSGPEGVATVVIDDAQPATPTVAIAPEAADLAATVSCTIVDQPKDADGDKLTYAYTWSVGSYVVPGATTQVVDIAKLTAGADGALVHSGAELRCSATASDGQKQSGQATSDAILLAAADICASAANPCSASATCTNTDTIVPVCVCKVGYVGDGKVCADIDECAANTDGCDLAANCTNTAGSFTCTCKDGYAGDGKSCADIDECTAATAGCSSQATCTNSVGSFTCTCKEGFSGDGKNCADIDECAANTDGCDLAADCSNTVGSFVCTCKSGYSGTGLACTDINECAGDVGPCTGNATCANTPGSFTCDCLKGYAGAACQDVNECLNGTATCGANATCTNNIGAYSCTCNSGYAGDGTVCVAVSCDDNIENGSESDKDCGGSCSKCANGKKCKGGGDCSGGFCDAAGHCASCLVAGDCPGSDSECSKRTCSAGTCGVSFAAPSTVLATQVAGDCQQLHCDGAGSVTSTALDGDVPDDGSVCTTDSCVAGAPAHTPLETGSACEQNGGKMCNADGLCVQCLVAGDCSGEDTSCQWRTCDSGVCGMANAPTDTALTDPNPGDCKHDACNGVGLLVSVPFDADVPDSVADCSTPVCSGGEIGSTPWTLGTSCAENSGVCDGNGSCVECNGASDCAGQDDECQQRVCIENMCGWAFTAAGTPVAEQITGDCMQDTCDGEGGYQWGVPLSSDVTADGNDCTQDTCSEGVPTFIPLNEKVCDDGNACTENDSCSGGLCLGSDITCTSGDVCLIENGCDATNGCQFVPSEPGTACNDADTCTMIDTCIDGTCTGTEAWGCTEPEVVATLPQAATSGVLESASISVTFNVPMDLGTLTSQAVSGECWGNVQISGDDFVNCLAIDAGLVTLSSDHKTLTVTPAPGFSFGSSYEVRVLAGATSDNGLSMAADFAMASAFSTRVAPEPVATWNESGAAGEVGYCVVQYPTNIVTSTYWSPTIYARIYHAGVTEAAGASEQVAAQIGWGPLESNPEWQGGWVWTDAAWNSGCTADGGTPVCGNNDEYMASIAVPHFAAAKGPQGYAPPLIYGTYSYAARFSIDGGTSWTYCDKGSGAGSNAGLAFETWNLPSLSVVQPN